MKKLWQWYSYTTPVENEELFMGRNPIRESILRGLSRPIPLSFGIIGGRRMGKTTLLRALERSLLPSFSTELFTIFPLYIDFYSLSPITQRNFYRNIFKKLLEHLALPIELTEQNLDLVLQLKRILHISEWNIEEYRLFQRNEEATAFVDFKEDLAIILKSARYPFRMILLLDEVEPLISKQENNIFFGNLRSLLSNTPPLSRHIALVMAGTRGLSCLAEERGSPLENILDIKHLEVFDKNATISLIQKPTNKQIQQKLQEIIYKQTGGHPFLIQYVMKHLCELDISLKKLNLKHLEAIIKQFYYERKDFNNWTSNFNEIEHQIYSQLLKKSYARRELLQIFPGTASSLDFLIHLGLLNRTNHNSTQHFSIASLMFADWYCEEWGIS